MISNLIKVLNNTLDINTRLEQMVSIAIVSSVDSELRRVKVTFPTGDRPESEWLSVPAARGNVSFNIEPGSQVVCLFPPVGQMLRGFVIGVLANAKTPPYSTDANKLGVILKDGTLFEYDQASSTATIKIKGGTPSVTVSPSKIELDGDVLITQNLTVMGAVEGNKTASFMQTVSAAGYTGPVSGSAASFANGANIQTTLTYKGQEVTTMPHTHTDAEGRPTSPAKG